MEKKEEARGKLAHQKLAANRAREKVYDNIT